MPREFDAYNENFVADRPDKSGKFAWLVRLYSYAPKPGFLGNVAGEADSLEQAKADAKAAAVAGLEKYRRAP